MDLINATAESMKQKFDGVEYVFEPNVLIQLTDDAGKHCLKKLKAKGLQTVRYGSDPNEISFKALDAIVQFHRTQIAIHEASNEEQEERKFPPLGKPGGVKRAEAALKVYEPVWQKAKDRRDAEEQAAFAAKLTATIDKKPEIPDLEEMSIKELADTLEGYGGEPGKTRSKKKLIEAIKIKAAELAAAEE